ncbi:MAG: 4-(cytidine 5'-diphospho)-2-C-methyl-D-erythritol kinase [Burkholderiaceae bacterium]|jgi:4-diphosphocytidyl-2-C-methyl-D-erythritol kinase|nr:4-(cytidine 5'-diphospho)-2-C-methyl-D-erythritol kinase [Burkholderiaceae bacterium]
MNTLYDLPAPAKLNLFLHVVGRRADGYHLLQSVFMLIDWCDRLHIERRASGKLSREDLSAPLPADDLSLRAARALQAYAGPGCGAHISIAKSIPAQAGLGGGSSDAATCLLALNRLWGLKLPLAQLERIGLSLGADVPFFLRGRNAWVEGVGETITPVDLPPCQFLVVKPVQGLDTAAIFRAPDLQRTTAPAIISCFAADSAPDSRDFAWDFGRNDLQPVAQRLCPEVEQAIQWLAAQGMQGRMTGSGSAVFAPVVTSTAQDVDPAQPLPGWTVRRCGNLPVHPLAGWADSDS